MFPLNWAFPSRSVGDTADKTFPFKNRCSDWQKTSCMTMECLAAAPGPDLWPPTSWEDHSLITDNYYEPDAPRESGKKYCLWTWPQELLLFLENFQIFSICQFSLKTHKLDLKALSKHPDLHARQLRNVTFHHREAGEALCLKVDVIYWRYHLTSTSNQKPQRVSNSGTCFTGGHQPSQSQVKKFGRLTILTSHILCLRFSTGMLCILFLSWQ